MGLVVHADADDEAVADEGLGGERLGREPWGCRSHVEITAVPISMGEPVSPWDPMSPNASMSPTCATQ